MRFAYFTVGMPEYTPEEAVGLLREAGYDGVEWRVTDQASTPDGRPGFWAGNRCTWPLSSFVEDAPRIRALAETAGLAMPNVGTYVTCDNLDSVEQAMRGAVLLGAPQLRVNTPRYSGEAGYLKRRDQARAQYREVADLARSYGVRALIEIHHGKHDPQRQRGGGLPGRLRPALRWHDPRRRQHGLRGARAVSHGAGAAWPLSGPRPSQERQLAADRHPPRRQRDLARGLGHVPPAAWWIWARCWAFCATSATTAGWRSRISRPRSQPPSACAATSRMSKACLPHKVLSFELRGRGSNLEVAFDRAVATIYCCRFLPCGQKTDNQ